MKLFVFLASLLLTVSQASLEDESLLQVGKHDLDVTDDFDEGDEGHEDIVSMMEDMAAALDQLDTNSTQRCIHTNSLGVKWRECWKICTNFGKRGMARISCTWDTVKKSCRPWCAGCR